MPKKRCSFLTEDDNIEIATHEGNGPNEAVARRAAISKFDWEGNHKDVIVDCD